MKTFCRQCGCHFPEDFKETQDSGCGWWESRNFPPNFAIDHEEWARKIWDWLFGFDHDAMGEDIGIMLICPEIKCSNDRYKGNQWEGEDPDGPKAVPGYKHWPDEKRRDFQKSWLRLHFGGHINDIVSDLHVKFGEKFNKIYKGMPTVQRNPL